jgi:hypothetical protein
METNFYDVLCVLILAFAAVWCFAIVAHSKRGEGK